MALCQISHFDQGDLLARLQAEVQLHDIKRVGSAVRITVGTTGGSFMFACGSKVHAELLMLTFQEVLK